MVNLILFLIILVLLALSIFAVFYLLYLFRTGIPFVPTSKPVAQKMVELAELDAEKKFVDLGCGEGTLVRMAGKSGAHGVGYELILPLVWLCRGANRLQKRPIEFRTEDFFQAELKEFDVIFCYLWPNAMKKFWTTFEGKLKPGARIISHQFPIENLTPEKTEIVGKSKIFVYRVPATSP
ncbi:MAG: class I SAM-dependent methyltransferase [Candidatus Gracilibacteria bacterium]|nr:class I SAM-dependent methyltransferase [Candidatus Gracilibacteria bacterium]